MKDKHFIFMLLLLLTHTLNFGQIIYEGTHDESFKTFQMDNGDIKYTKYNKSEQTVSVYNLDHSIWKTIHLPIPKEHTLDEIKSISQNVFNSDTLMELAYSCVEYHITNNLEGTNGNYVDIQFTLNIINEKGEMILKADNSNDLNIVESNGIRKLLIYKHVGQGFETSGQIEVYSIPEKY
ncbi:MAG: hypothetical protein DRQ42_07510 [Gammaproteobacteria bacterium]|nr:MAG: hypothetical protein DRQ42_07510 [Gammaproteobacteria bacterium]